jgi:hypothetical protein
VERSIEARPNALNGLTAIPALDQVLPHDYVEMRRVMPMRNKKTATSHAGFSLVELTVIVAITGVLLGTAVMFRPSWMASASADGGLETVLRAFRLARERAIAERRNVEVRFINPNQIQVVRRDVVGIVEVGTTLLETFTFEGDMRFQVISGVPDLGVANNLVAGTGVNGVNDGTATADIFTSEGTFVDQAGDPLNLEVFIARRDERLSSRAVTVFGSTALIRGFTWNGQAWSE